MRSTDTHFLLAVKRPFTADNPGYARFAEHASSVHYLDEGSQVFIYPRGNFDYGYDEGGDADEFSGFVWGTAVTLGNLAVDTSVLPVEDKVISTDFIPV